MGLRQGWLSPSGEFVECNSYDHLCVARSLAGHLNTPDYDQRRERTVSADEKLMNAGWVYIGISSFMCHEWRIGWARDLSPEQRIFLKPYFEDGDGLPVNDVAIMRWEMEREK